MSVASSTGSFQDCLKSVDDKIEAGFTFGQVEDFINDRPIDEQHKAALWLWAWAHQSPDAKHGFADDALSAASERRADEAEARSH
jgi:hypothetical protein